MPAIAKVCDLCGRALIGRHFIATIADEQFCWDGSVDLISGRAGTCHWSILLEPGKVRAFNASGAMVNEGIRPLWVVPDTGGTTGTWQGISRSQTPQFKSTPSPAPPMTGAVFQRLLDKWGKP